MGVPDPRVEAEKARVEIVRAIRGPEAWDRPPDLGAAHRAVCAILAAGRSLDIRDVGDEPDREFIRAVSGGEDRLTAAEAHRLVVGVMSMTRSASDNPKDQACAECGATDEWHDITCDTGNTEEKT